MQPENVKALITGGVSGLGLGVAEHFVAHGGKVALFDLDAERAAKVASIAGVTALSGDPTEALQSLTDGEGFDVVFDATGNAQAMQRGF